MQQMVKSIYGEAYIETDDYGFITKADHPFRAFEGSHIDDLYIFYEHSKKYGTTRESNGDVSGENPQDTKVFSLQFKESIR